MRAGTYDRPARVTLGLVLLHATRYLLVTLALLACAPACSGATQGAGRAKPDGHPVVVTPEMIGAGIVSSGVSLPAPPPVTGSREAPTKAWDARCRTRS